MFGYYINSCFEGINQFFDKKSVALFWFISWEFSLKNFSVWFLTNLILGLSYIVGIDRLESGGRDLETVFSSVLRLGPLKEKIDICCYTAIATITCFPLCHSSHNIGSLPLECISKYSFQVLSAIVLGSHRALPPIYRLQADVQTDISVT